MQIDGFYAVMREIFPPNRKKRQFFHFAFERIFQMKNDLNELYQWQHKTHPIFHFEFQIFFCKKKVITSYSIRKMKREFGETI